LLSDHGKNGLNPLGARGGRPPFPSHANQLTDVNENISNRHHGEGIHSGIVGEAFGVEHGLRDNFLL
jgi:hypothetical protein